MNTDPLSRSANWRVETEVTPHKIDPRIPDVAALQEHNLVDSKEIVGRHIRIVSERNENTRERASQLRKLAAEALAYFQLDSEKRGDIEYILAELISNAYRYSVSGPVWLSIVQTIGHIKKKETCVLDVTVMNKAADRVPEVIYEGAVDVDEDGLPEVSVHGRGDPIMDALALEHGRFERDQMIGAYALIGCTLDDETRDSLLAA
jgi:anti-sigma regulatory factor (Ser/Thr protein kinase)